MFPMLFVAGQDTMNHDHTITMERLFYVVKCKTATRCKEGKFINQKEYINIHSDVKQKEAGLVSRKGVWGQLTSCTCWWVLLPLSRCLPPLLSSSLPTLAHIEMLWCSGCNLECITACSCFKGVEASNLKSAGEALPHGRPAAVKQNNQCSSSIDRQPQSLQGCKANAAVIPTTVMSR